MNTQTINIPGLETLALLRDELKLQVYLGKAELKEEWEKLEPKWVELEAKVKTLEKVSVEVAKGLKTPIDLLIDELGKGYERIRKAL